MMMALLRTSCSRVKPDSDSLDLHSLTNQSWNLNPNLSLTLSLNLNLNLNPFLNLEPK